MTHRTFRREPRKGEVIRGDVHLPDGAEPRSAVVVIHGFKGFKDWAFFPWLSRRLADAGYAVVRFNFSRNGIGDDPERFTELDAFGANTLSLEQEELRSVVSGTLGGELLPWRPKKVALVGHSRGGAQAVLAAAAEPRVTALVTWSAVSHFDRWTTETKERWRHEGRIWVLNRRTGQQMPLGVDLLEDFETNRKALDVVAAASRVRAPWLIVHGSEDLTVWPGEAQTLARANPEARLHLVQGAGHTYQAAHPFAGPTSQLREVADLTVEHLRRHVEP